MSLAKKLLKAYNENAIQEVLQESDSWETMYHLSPMRQNLLEWYEFKADAVILEVGAQAGVLTGFFASRAKKIVALEKDAELLEVNKVRNKRFDNIEFCLGSMDNLESENKYDYIVFVGTFEQGLLKTTKKLLKQDGILIIAGDNKMAMKYWAGAPDHSNGSVFSGITNNYKNGESRSFSKIEYEEFLKKEGFCNLTFYYPTPDYRFVSCLYSDDYLPQMGELRPENGVYEQGGYQFFEERWKISIFCRIIFNICR